MNSVKRCAIVTLIHISAVAASLFVFVNIAWGCVAENLLEPDYAAHGVARGESGDILYTEEVTYQVDDTGGTLRVRYRDQDNTLLADKVVRYNCKLTTPSFTLSLPDNQVAESVKWLDDEVITFANGKKKTLSPPQGASIVDAGFDFAIRTSWDQLVSGEKLVYQYLIPRKGRFLKLRFQQAQAFELPGISDAEDLYFFRVAANNFLFRILSSPIIVGYEKARRDIRYYIGPSNLPMFDNGENVIITYTPHRRV